MGEWEFQLEEWDCGMINICIVMFNFEFISAGFERQKAE